MAKNDETQTRILDKELAKRQQVLERALNAFKRAAANTDTAITEFEDTARVTFEAFDSLRGNYLKQPSGKTRTEKQVLDRRVVDITPKRLRHAREQVAKLHDQFDEIFGLFEGIFPTQLLAMGAAIVEKPPKLRR